MKLDVRTHCVNTINRKNKIYSKKAEMSTFVPNMESPVDIRGHRSDFHWPSFFNDALKHRLRVDCNIDLDKLHLKIFPIHGARESWTVTLTMVEEVDRPKNIPSDEEILKKFPHKKALAQAIVYACEYTQNECDRVKSRNKQINHATRLLQWYTKTTHKRAKQNMRFTQKLAALTAEYQAEVAAIAKAELKKALKYIEDNKHTDAQCGSYSPEDLELFEKYGVKYVEEHTDDGLPSILRVQDDGKWLAEKKKEEE